MSKITLRCAVYTRKSTEEGLDQAFNSLDAQREACSAFAVSQAGLGWKLLPDHYDDGGISGGTMERPALQRLLQDIRDRKVDIVVVYKIDRLTRSLMDFARIVEIFDANYVSFVSVTQAFNTTTSMGRLTLNVLLSFAQFEREVTAERIRDKIAASKKKGMWMGGRVPLGYRAENKKLKIDPEQADRVRYLFSHYLELQSVSELVEEDRHRCVAMRDGHIAPDQQPTSASRWRSLSRGQLYDLLANPLYIGKVKHRDQVFDGEHEAIVDADIFERVQHLLKRQAPERRSVQNSRDVHRLTGILFDETGDRLSPAHTTNHGKRYRYYVSSRLKLRANKDACGWRIAASELERIVDDELCRVLTDETQLVDWVREHASADRIGAALAAARKLGADSIEQRQVRHNAPKRVFRRIALSPSAIRFEIDGTALITVLLGIEAAHGTDHRQEDGETGAQQACTAIIERPITIKRRGVEARIVVAGASVPAKPDQSLIDLLGRAHAYLDRLTNGSANSIAELAHQIGLHRADISRILPLAFLSPSITAAILSGRQPAEMMARSLSRLVDVPAAWAEQAEVLTV